MIETKGLTKFFGNIRAINNLSVNIPQGINGIIGPNGSGKTTLFHILVGLLKPDSGYVSVLGLDPWSKRHELLKNVNILLETLRFPKNVSGLRYLMHVAKLRNVPERDVYKTLQEVKLTQDAEKEVSCYSSGMLKRLGIAKAILGNPELIILDEPTSGLDPIGRRDLLKLIIRLRKERKINFLISSHVLTELQKVCSWVCLMYNGNSVEQGFISDIVEKYSSKIYIIKVSNPEKLMDALKSIRNLKVRVRGNSIYLKGDDSVIQNEVVKLISQANVSLISFYQVGTSLEDVFVKIIKTRGVKQ